MMEERGSESQACGGEGPAMDTPDRNRIATPVSQFQDSPVFNYINNLSPIKTVKSVRINQTFNSFSFASLPSIFTSPHVNSLKESRFLRRHQFSDPSKPEFSSKHGEKVDGNEGVMDVVHNSDEQEGNVDPGCCIGEASVEPTYECSKLVVDGSQNPSYDWCATTCRGVETRCASEFASKLGSVVPLANEVSETGSIGSEMHLEGIKNIEQNKEGAGSDWESLISDAADLLVFDSPNNTEAFNCPSQKSLDTGTSLCSSPVAEFREDENNDLQNTEAVGPVGVEQWESENLSTQVREGHLKEPEATRDIFASTSLKRRMMEEPSGQIDNEPVSNLHRGMRRRCLVFDMSGARRKHLDDTSGSGSSMTSQSDANVKSNDQQPVPMKAVSDSSRCILPGIGLHLNSLARTSKDYDIVSHGTLISGRQLINDPTSTSSLHFLTSGQEPLNNSLAVTSMERNIDVAENGVQDLDDASQASGYTANEEINQTSPRKKRRKLENAAESEGCKRCNCKKSKCLKLYCDCFAAGVYCVETCSCQGCFNKPIHEDTVLATRKQIESRNPLAFAPKVVRSSDSGLEIGDESSKTPASARHKRGCNCKKSGCLKKYCECYQIGVGCSINCRCEGCKNAFGRKDGAALIGTESELEEEETETCERSVVDKSLQKNVIRNSVEPNPDSTLPATPLQPGGSLVHSKSKLPRSSFLSIGSSSGFYGSQKFGKRNFLQPQPKFEKQLEAVQEDDMPGVLQENCSPTSGVKSASPNSKRVSPPHSEFGSSSGRKSSRKLILQSIPSFPSLTPKH